MTSVSADREGPEWSAHVPEQQERVLLIDLDEYVLVNIMAWLPDPQALSATCSTLHAVSTTLLCRQLWFQRWYPSHPVARHRPLVLAAISWRGCRPASIAQQQQAAPAQPDSVSPVVKLICSTAAHLLQHRPQQQTTREGQSQSFRLPLAVSLADVACAPQGSKQQLQLLKHLTPWHEHLLVPAAAAAGNCQLLRSLLQERVQPPGSLSTTSGYPPCFCTSSSSTTAFGCAAGSSSSSGCSSDCCLPHGAQQLHHWLWQSHKQQPSPGQRPSRPCWGTHLQPLPDYPGLQAFRHNILQTSLIAAAKAGSVHCLQLLLGQLVQCHASVWDCAEALTAVAEAAAAAGRLECLRLVWKVLQPPAAVAHAKQDAQQHQYQLWQEAGSQANAEEPGAGAGSEGFQQSIDMSLALQNLNLQQHQQYFEHQQHQQEQGQQQQQQQTLAAASALQLVGASTYLLVAAAGSGCPRVLSAVMQNMQAHLQKQQLPAALAATGQRGHLAALTLLLQHPELSSRPLQLAACDAAMHGWPPNTLLPLLDCMACAYNQDLIPLLAKPLVVALQHTQQAVAGAVMDVLAEHAALDQADLLADALLLLAYQGQAGRVSWIIKVAPTVLVKLGQRAAAAALEGGHPRLAQSMLDVGATRPPAFKAAAKRGQLTAAVAAGDAAAVRELLQEVQLPLVWSCETIPASGQGGAVAGGAGVVAGMPGAAAAAASPPAADAAARVTQPTQCLLTLLKRAALLDGPAGVDILRQLLWVLTDSERQANARQHVLVSLAKACFAAGRVEQLMAVVEAVGRPCTVQRRLLRRFLAELRSCLQLPCSTLQYNNHAHHHQQQQQQQMPNASCPQLPMQPGSSCCSSDGVLAAAVALMEAPQCCDMVSGLLTQSYLAVCMPGEYLGATPRPAQPAVHIPSLHSLVQLLLQLADKAELPPGARYKDLPLFRMFVRTVLQSCDPYLLHALLLLMQRHEAEVIADMPEDAMRALGTEAEMVEAEGQG